MKIDKAGKYGPLIAVRKFKTPPVKMRTAILFKGDPHEQTRALKHINEYFSIENWIASVLDDAPPNENNEMCS